MPPLEFENRSCQDVRKSTHAPITPQLGNMEILGAVSQAAAGPILAKFGLLRIG